MWPFRVSATPQMRVLVALAAVALVGLAIRARRAAAGSKKPGVSISVDFGPAPVKVDASSGGADASVDVSTPAATVDAAVDSSAQAPVSAAVDTSTQVAGATVDVAEFFGRDRVHSGRPDHGSGRHDERRRGVGQELRRERQSGRFGRQSARRHEGLDADRIRRDSRLAASVGASNEGSPAVALPPRTAGAAKPVRPQAVGRPAARRTRPAAAVPTLIPPVTAVPRNTVVAGRTGSTPQPEFIGVLAGSSRPDAEHAPDAAPGASVTAATWHRPVATPGTGGASGASGSGLSTAGFFAILTAFLMLAAPIVGRWLRPSIGLTLQPACASLPERPG